MEDIIQEDDFRGANWTYSTDYKKLIDHITTKRKKYLPPELTEICNDSRIFILSYCIIFLVASTGNLIAIHCFWRKFKRNRSVTTLLLLHLSLADLIVCCTLIPTEVVWRVTIQWMGGNVLCKVTQVFRTFGLYLSSLVLIGVSFSRVLAVMFPMSTINSGTYKKIKWMLVLAWVTAAIFSAPQAIFFSVVVHPEYPSFTQCITDEYQDNFQYMKMYSVFSLAVIYFVPLLVIICTYTAIILKLVKKSQERSQLNDQNVAVYICRSNQMCDNNDHAQDNGQIDGRQSINYGYHAHSLLSKAKAKTLAMTAVIVTAFVFCWTPYAFMTLWYMFDWNGAKKVDSRVQNGLFLMAVANSCINPLIYGGFSNTCNKIQRMASYCYGNWCVFARQ